MGGVDELQENLKYRKIKGISRGGFGFVDLCENRETHELVAIKFIERGERVTHRTERQILNHQALVHPHVVHLIEVFNTPSYLAIVMEYVDGGTLLDHINKLGRLDEDEARWYFQQLIIALDYLHRKEIASRDMKLQNILMCGEPYQRPLLKLSGFGHAKDLLLSHRLGAMLRGWTSAAGSCPGSRSLMGGVGVGPPSAHTSRSWLRGRTLAAA